MFQNLLFLSTLGKLIRLIWETQGFHLIRPGLLADRQQHTCPSLNEKTMNSYADDNALAGALRVFRSIGYEAARIDDPESGRVVVRLWAPDYGPLKAMHPRSWQGSGRNMQDALTGLALAICSGLPPEASKNIQDMVDRAVS